jgi:hypothetical protein
MQQHTKHAIFCPTAEGAWLPTNLRVAHLSGNNRNPHALTSAWSCQCQAWQATAETGSACGTLTVHKTAWLRISRSDNSRSDCTPAVVVSKIVQSAGCHGTATAPGMQEQQQQQLHSLLPFVTS